MNGGFGLFNNGRAMPLLPRLEVYHLEWVPGGVCVEQYFSLYSAFLFVFVDICFRLLFFVYFFSQDVAVMPSLFSRRYYNEVFGQVVFMDPVGNERNIFLSRADGRIFLTVGWGGFGDFYGLVFGGWFSVVYVSLGRFFIRVFNNFGDEVPYPAREIPLLPVDHDLLALPAIPPVGDLADALEGPLDVDLNVDNVLFPYGDRVFSHSIVKVLTYEDLLGNALVSFFLLLFFNVFFYGMVIFLLFYF